VPFKKEIEFFLMQDKSLMLKKHQAEILAILAYFQ